MCYCVLVSAIERAIEKVQRLDAEQIRQLLAWLEACQERSQSEAKPLGARAMLGFARRFRADARHTADWMAELRDGERN